MPPKKRPAKPRSCDVCHKGKIQCNPISDVQCDWCKHQGRFCTFDRPFGRKKKTAIRSISQDITPRTPKDALSSSEGDPNELLIPDRMIRITPAGCGGFYFNGVHVGGISSDRGVPFFTNEGVRWIIAHTGSEPRLTPSPKPSTLTEADVGEWDLPDKTVVDFCLTLFTTSTRRYVFPLIDEATFDQVVVKAYTGNPDVADVLCARACVLAFVCIGVHLQGPQHFHGINAEQYAAHVHRLMPTLLSNPTSESIQACTMMCMYNMFTGSIAAASTYLSVAYRFLTMFGAHLNSSPSRYLRKVFWHCYIYDKDIYLRAGYPPIINDHHVDLTLPPGYKNMEDFETYNEATDPLPGDMRLTIIKSNAIRLLHCLKAFQSSEVELLQNIMELDEELERWRMSIEPPYRPSLATGHKIRVCDEWPPAKQVHVIVIHFEYYFLLALIHSASGRCRRVPAGIETGMEVVDHRASLNSCQSLALQASRATLANLGAAARILSRGDFWYFVPYPVSASLTIFCNILTTPLNEHVQHDLDSLQKVPALIRDMFGISRSETNGHNDNLRTRQVEHFIDELVRLGRAAADTAVGQ